MRIVLATLALVALAGLSGCESEPVSNAEAQAADTSAPPAPMPAESASPSAEAPAAAAPAADATPAAAPPAETPAAPADPNDPTLKKAEVGAGKKGRDYGGPGFITTPVEVYFRTGDRIAFEVHIPKNMELYKAQHENKGPKTHEEFMQVIVKEGGVDLPELPADEEYLYDPKTEQLMIRRMQPQPAEAPQAEAPKSE